MALNLAIALQKSGHRVCLLDANLGLGNIDLLCGLNGYWNLSHVVSICAGGLLISFFLPWITFLFGKPSGLDFAKEGGKFLFLWSIPIFSALTIFAGVTKQSQKIIAQLTGALPFAVLGFGLYPRRNSFTRATSSTKPE